MAEPTKAIRLSNVQVGGAPHRCVGALAAAVVLGAETAKERVLVQGASTLRAVVKLSAVAGTATLKITPLLSDANENDKASGTQRTTNIQTSASLVAATEASLDYTIVGDRLLDVSIVSGTSGTISYVDLYLQA